MRPASTLAITLMVLMTLSGCSSSKWEVVAKGNARTKRRSIEFAAATATATIKHPGSIGVRFSGSDGAGSALWSCQRRGHRSSGRVALKHADRVYVLSRVAGARSCFVGVLVNITGADKTIKVEILKR
jgi:hypothetical protein